MKTNCLSYDSMTDVFNRFRLCRANLVTFTWLCCNTGGSEQATPCYFLCGPGDAESEWRCRCRKGFRGPQPRIATGSPKLWCTVKTLGLFGFMLSFVSFTEHRTTAVTAAWQLQAKTRLAFLKMRDAMEAGTSGPRSLGAPRGLGFFVSKGSCTARLVTWSRFWNLYLGQKQQLLRTRPVWCLVEPRPTRDKLRQEKKKLEAKTIRDPRLVNKKVQQKTILHIAVPQYDGPIRHWDLSFK